MNLTLAFLIACQTPPSEPSGVSAQPTAAPSVAPVPGRSVPPPAKAARPASTQTNAPPTPTAFHAKPTFELQGTASESPKSIVLISLDTVGAEHLSVYGGPAETPSLAHVAETGTLFSQAIAHFPETCLSHWSMWTGVPPEAHGDAPVVRGSVTTVPTVAEIASRHGYRTAAFIGGVTLTDHACGFGRGFDLIDDRFPLDPLDMKRPANEVSQKAAHWIQSQRGPYVAFVHYFDAHFPYTPSPPWDTHYDPDYTGPINGSDAVLRPYRDGKSDPSERDVAHVRALYHGEISELDAHLAPVLEAAGPDAIVLITSDHGESFGHNYWFNHRNALWDEIIRVPLLIRGPGVPTGTIIDHQVGLTDIAPTLLELAGLPTDQRMAGQSLRATMQGGQPERSRVFSTTDPTQPDRQLASRTNSEKVVLSSNEIKVYNPREDPQEQTPLVASGIDRDEVTSAYEQTIAVFSSHRVSAPPPPPMDPEEAARLEALGYLVPGSDGRPPPGGAQDMPSGQR